MISNRRLGKVSRGRGGGPGIGRVKGITCSTNRSSIVVLPSYGSGNKGRRRTVANNAGRVRVLQQLLTNQTITCKVTTNYEQSTDENTHAMDRMCTKVTYIWTRSSHQCWPMVVHQDNDMNRLVDIHKYIHTNEIHCGVNLNDVID